MAASVVQSKIAAVNTPTAANTVTWDTAATAGNVLVIIVCADAVIPSGNRPSGFTLSTGMEQVANNAHDLFWAVASGGETSRVYTLSAAAVSCWITLELAGLEAAPYDTSNGQSGTPSGWDYTTPAITPSSGDRYLLASIGGARSAENITGLSAWLNSHVEIRDVFNTLASGPRVGVGVADRSVTGNGSTTFSSGATFTVTSPPETATGLIIAFKISAAAEGPPINVRLDEPELGSGEFE